MDVYRRIDKIIEDRGMSRRQLALDASIPATTLQSALSRKKNMTVEMLTKISDALKIPLHDLLSVDEIRSTVEGERIQDHEARFHIVIGKLLPGDELRMLEALNTTIEYISRAITDEQTRTITRLSELILFFGKMVLQGFEMRFCTSEDKPEEYLIFLRHYEALIKLAEEHKEEVINSAIYARGGENQKLMQLIYGEGDPK